MTFQSLCPPVHKFSNFNNIPTTAILRLWLRLRYLITVHMALPTSKLRTARCRVPCLKVPSWLLEKQRARIIALNTHQSQARLEVYPLAALIRTQKKSQTPSWYIKKLSLVALVRQRYRRQSGNTTDLHLHQKALCLVAQAKTQTQ